MNFREMNRAVFAGERLPHVLFQPRIEPWFAWHKEFGCMPERYAPMSLLQFFDHLDVSMRYVQYYTDQPEPVIQGYTPDVTIREVVRGDRKTIIYETPHGDLVEEQHYTTDHTWRTREFAVKDPGDLAKLRWLYAHRTYRFSRENFAVGSAFMGERGEPQFWLPRSPYQALALDWMRYTDFVYAMADSPEEMIATMQAIDDSYDALYGEITASGMVKIANFGENLHAHLLPPRYVEGHLIPWYTRRSGQLRDAGIYTHVHLDGGVRGMLPYLKALPFDGIEALTPEPQGDVTLEEIKDHIGDKVVLDMIPAVLFMETYSREQLMQTVEKVVDLFHPRLVLGISDELPEGASEEAVARVRLVAEWCRQQRP